MSKKLFKLTAKNFRIVMRSRISSLIVIFGPILVMVLVGLAFNNSAGFDLNIAVHVSEKTDLSDRFVETLKDNFNVYEEESLDDCVANVVNLRHHACLEFPLDFKVESGNKNTITIHVDNTQENVKDLIQGTLNRVILIESESISSDLTKVLLVSITDISGKLNSWTNRVNAEITPLQTEIGTQADASKALLNNLQLSEGTTDTSDLDSFSSSISSAYTNMQSTAQKARSELNSLINEVRDLNISNSGLEDALDAADAQLATIIINSSVSSTDITNLQNAINSVKTSLTSLEDSVSSANQAKTDVVTKLDTISEKITQTKTQLTKLAVELEVTKAMLNNIKIKDATSIVSPVSSEIAPVATQSSKLIYMSPALLVMVLMLVTIILSATMVVLEKSSPARFRLFTTPTSDFWYIVSVFLTVFLISILQMVFLLVVGYFAFDIPVFANFAVTAVILLLGATIFTFIGMSIGYLFSNEQTAVLAAIFMCGAFLFISDIFLPIDNIPDNIQFFIELTPFVFVSTLMRRSLLFEASFGDIWMDLLILLAYCIGLFILILGAHKLMKTIFLISNVRKGKQK